MRWMKHLTATRRDEKVARMISCYGYRTYGIWWAVLETVAENFDGINPSLTYPLSTWSHLLSLRGSLVWSSLSTLEVTGVLTANRQGDEVTVTIPNLLKYRDEYTRKSVHNPDNVRTKIEIQSIDVKEQKELIPRPTFELPDWMPKEAWDSYVDMRKRSSHPLTPDGRKKLIGKLTKWHAEDVDIAACLDNSVAFGYRGVFQPNERSNGNGKGKPSVFDIVQQTISELESGSDPRSRGDAGV